jgi:hypothetical protein
LTDLLAQIEGSALAAWTRESTSIWAYPTVLTLHTLGLGILVGAGSLIDLRLLGFAPRMPIGSLQPLFPVMWWAFTLNAVTGVMLFMADAVHRAGQRVFHVKLVLVIAALVVTASVRSFVSRQSDELATRIDTRGRQLAWLSLILWAAATVAGRLMAYL